MLFRIDVYFSEYFLAVKIDEQNHKDREPIVFMVSQKKLYMIEMLQNFERVLWNHILVNIPNFKSIDAKLKKLS